MTMTETTRVAELAARFNALKREDVEAYNQLSATAAERKAIVIELLATMPARDVAKTLGIVRSRVYAIAGKRKP